MLAEERNTPIPENTDTAENTAAHPEPYDSNSNYDYCGYYRGDYDNNLD